MIWFNRLIHWNEIWDSDDSSINIVICRGLRNISVIVFNLPFDITRMYATMQLILVTHILKNVSYSLSLYISNID